MEFTTCLGLHSQATRLSRKGPEPGDAGPPYGTITL